MLVTTGPKCLIQAAQTLNFDQTETMENIYAIKSKWSSRLPVVHAPGSFLSYLFGQDV